MNRIKCTVSYDGSGYVGWQTQGNLPSVQLELEKALAIMHKTKIDIHASGRTDAGVHAIGQVFHFDSPLSLLPENWKRAINGYTKHDIFVSKVELVSLDFHSRHDCIQKTYEYRFCFEEYNVHRAKYCTQLNTRLDIVAMKEACQVFVGTHDFTSFNANTLEERPYQIRTITNMTMYQEGTEWVVQVTGEGFLRYMVRMMVGTLIEVGKGKLDQFTIRSWLEQKDKICCRHNAPPQGLYLKEVSYE